jgi:hypothetical protein
MVYQMPGTGGPLMAPSAPAMPGSASTTYDGNSVTSRVSGGGGGGPLEDMLRKLIEKKTNPIRKHENRAALAGTRTNRAGRQRVTSDARLPVSRGPSWQQMQGVAMTPVGLGPGSIPGMGIDPRKLPPSMRPDAGQLVGPMHSTPQGSIAPAEPDAPLTAQPSAGGGGVDPRMAALGELFQGLFRGGK